MAVKLGIQHSIARLHWQWAGRENYKPFEPLQSDMGVRNRITQNRQTVRIASALALAAIAVWSFINGNRLRGVLAAGGALAVGATASTLEPTELEVQQVTDLTEERDSTEASGLRCSSCTEPIVPGQSRRPTETNEIVHESCL